MRAAVLRNQEMVLDDLDDLSAGPGQVLVEVLACGICGSDLHTVHGAHELVRTAKEAGRSTFMFDPDQDLVMGHEISVRVLETGPDVTNVSEGQIAAGMPFLDTPEGRRVPGYDNKYPGGYCERMLLSPESLVPVPNGLDPLLAALTEPLAVGLHAVNESGITPERTAVVIGTGPVGLAVIAALASKGVRSIIGADFSPTRRSVAEQMGATAVVDPAVEDPFDLWRSETNNTADPASAPVVFEAVGVPGMIDQLMRTAPERSVVVVVGVCMQPDSFHPTFGIYKHLTLRFVLGWTPEEFRKSLHDLAEGQIDGSLLVTGRVGIEGVPQAFVDLGNPEEHVKILVQPSLG